GSWTRASAGLACRPYLLGRPLSSPVGGDRRVVDVRLSVDRGVELDQVLDLEPRVAKQAEQVAVCEVELDPSVRPLEPVHSSLRTLESLGSRVGLLHGAQDVERATPQKDEAAAG